jgi:hypothetical protein
MDDRRAIEAVIARVVTAARIPDRREREDLQRELRAHFEDAAAEHGSAEAAIANFGRVDEVTSTLRLVYRAQYLAAYALKTSAGCLASIAVGLLIELSASRPGRFREMAAIGCVVAVSVVLGHEFNRKRRRLRAVSTRRWLAAFLAIAAFEYGYHNFFVGIPFGALRSAAAGGIVIAVAASTAFIMTRADRAFTLLFKISEA